MPTRNETLLIHHEIEQLEKWIFYRSVYRINQSQIWNRKSINRYILLATNYFNNTNN